MSPEQFTGAPADPALARRIDVYALGCVLHACLTGHEPFPRGTFESAMWAHVHEPPPSIRAIRPDLPAALDGVLARALAKDPLDRYPSAGALVEAARRTASPAIPERSASTRTTTGDLRDPRRTAPVPVAASEVKGATAVPRGTADPRELASPPGVALAVPAGPSSGRGERRSSTARSRQRSRPWRRPAASSAATARAREAGPRRPRHDRDHHCCRIRRTRYRRVRRIDGHCDPPPGPGAWAHRRTESDPAAEPATYRGADTDPHPAAHCGSHGSAHSEADGSRGPRT